MSARESGHGADRRTRSLFDQAAIEHGVAPGNHRGARSLTSSVTLGASAPLRLGPPSAIALTFHFGGGLIGVDDLAHQFPADHVDG